MAEVALYSGAVILGASGAGKSTLLAALRTRLKDHPCVSFPGRLTTRPPRADDVSWENISVSLHEMTQREAAGNLLMRWQKPLRADKSEHYAFPRLARQTGVGVLGGNDALIENASSIRPDPSVLHRLFKILVVCAPEVRRHRLLTRSPELAQNPSELSARMRPTPLVVKASAHMVLDNTTGFGAGELRSLEETLVAMGSRVVDEV